MAQTSRELALDAADLAGTLRHVNRKADRPAGVLEATLYGLTDPKGRVRREPEPLAPVELLDGADEAQHPLLDQVTEGEALALIAARVSDHQAEVGIDHAFFGCQVPALDPLCEFDLLTRLEQRVPASLTQKQLQRVQGRVDLVLGVAASWGVGDGARFGGPSLEVSSPTQPVGIIRQFCCFRNHSADARDFSPRPAAFLLGGTPVSKHDRPP